MSYKETMVLQIIGNHMQNLKKQKILHKYQICG